MESAPQTLFWEILSRLGWSLPSLCALSVGLWICLRHQASRPRAARPALAGFVLFIVMLFLRIGLHSWVVMRPPAGSGSALRDLVMAYAGLNMLAFVGELSAWACLLLGLHRAFRGSGAEA